MASVNASTVGGMAWWAYVQRIAGNATQEQIARSINVSTPSVGRWRTSTPRPENVAAFARAYHRPVLEAFIAAGFLTTQEAGEQPTALPLSPLPSLTDDELLDEVRRRMTGRAREVQPAEAEQLPDLPDPVSPEPVIDLLYSGNVAADMPPGPLDFTASRQRKSIADAMPVDMASDNRGE